VSAKYSFQLESRDPRRALPYKIIIGRDTPETEAHVVLKLLAYLLFFRERLQIEVNLHDDSIPFVPDLVQLDYELRPALWVECGECSVDKLDRLAVKAPEAELWVVKRSRGEVEALARAMTRMELRRNRYRLLGLDAAMFEEVCGLLRNRNRVFWVQGGFDPPQLQFDFNGLWFDAPFSVLEF
jgi:hypothetical protein